MDKRNLQKPLWRPHCRESGESGEILMKEICKNRHTDHIYQLCLDMLLRRMPISTNERGIWDCAAQVLIEMTEECPFYFEVEKLVMLYLQQMIQESSSQPASFSVQPTLLDAITNDGITIKQLTDLAEQMGAGSIKVIIGDRKSRSFGAVIVVRGEDAPLILDAIEAAEREAEKMGEADVAESP